MADWRPRVDHANTGASLVSRGAYLSKVDDHPDDHPKDECGVVAVYSLRTARPADIAHTSASYSLQHRGQESAGIAVSDGETVRVQSGMGLVNQVFRNGELKSLNGPMAIGHTRYSTTGSSQQCNVQPFLVEGLNGHLALGHNGNIVDPLALQQRLAKQWGCEFTSTTDSEAIAYLLANAPGATWEERAAYCMRTLRGAYSAVGSLGRCGDGLPRPPWGAAIVFGRVGWRLGYGLRDLCSRSSGGEVPT